MEPARPPLLVEESRGLRIGTDLGLRSWTTTMGKKKTQGTEWTKRFATTDVMLQEQITYIEDGNLQESSIIWVV